MPKINEWVIPKNIEKPVETVYEIKNEKEYQAPSFEEFMKTYEVDEKVGNSYKNEFAERDKNPSYGPGNNQSSGSYSDNSDLAKRQRFAGRAVTGIITGAVGKFAGPVPGIVYGATVKTVGEIGHALSSSDEAKDAWKYTSDLGGDIAIGSMGGGVVEQIGGQVFGNCSVDLIREGWEMWNEKGGKEKFQMNYHEFHRARGEDYSGFCDVCKS